jgi:AraC-like DNA-binding protein
MVILTGRVGGTGVRKRAGLQERTFGSPTTKRAARSRPPAGSASVLLLRVIAAGLPAGHPTWTAFLRELGDPRLDVPDARIPFSALVRAWDLAASIAGDTAYGLHLAERLPVGAFDLLDYLTRASPELGAAFDTWVRYQRLLVEDAMFEIDRAPGLIRVRAVTRQLEGGMFRQGIDYGLAGFLVRARQFTGATIVARAVRLKHVVGDPAEYARVFGAPVSLDRVDELELDGDVASLPIVHADAGLVQVLERQARSALEALPPLGRNADRIRAEVARRIALREPADLRAIAAALRLSERSLQRALVAEGATFSGIQEQVRRELAFQWLREGRLSLGELSWALGYGDPSAFHRAFIRWTGLTPGAWRTRFNSV